MVFCFLRSGVPFLRPSKFLVRYSLFFLSRSCSACKQVATNLDDHSIHRLPFAFFAAMERAAGRGASHLVVGPVRDSRRAHGMAVPLRIEASSPGNGAWLTGAAAYSLG